jgi:hypothetical protein
MLALLNESVVLEPEVEQKQKQDLAKEAAKLARKPAQSRHHSNKEIEM